jgi:hypothetical protein
MLNNAHEEKISLNNIIIIIKMSKNSVRATLTKYHKFWRCPKASIKALL